MTIVQAIFAEGTDYTKKSVETRLAFVEKLAAFVAQATKTGELHLDLLKGG